MDYFKKRKEKWDQTENNEIQNLLKNENIKYISKYIDIALNQWFNKKNNTENNLYYKKWNDRAYLFNEVGDLSDNSDNTHWSISGSLRVIEPNSVIKIK